MMQKVHSEDVRRAVRETYGRIAKAGTAGCGCACSPEAGYTEAERSSLPEGADMALGSGNPLAFAALRPGETVLDLGSGGGVDCFLAAQRVGRDGHVIGVDMTPEMVSKARRNAETAGAANVEFRLGEIEHLPVADASVDVVLSNCVINLSPDKAAVYRDAYRVLKPGGRLAISDVVATAELPEEARHDLARHVACVSGAAGIAELQRILGEAGFEQVRVRPQDETREVLSEWAPGGRIEDYVLAATIEAVKPEA
jgi:SAM-dependent methyltransferase